MEPERVEPGLAKVHPLLRVRLFSTMDVHGPSGASLLPKGRKTRGVLAVLALNAGRAVMRDELTELLWSRREREQARASLRQAVHELGDVLGGIDPALFLVDRTYLSLGNAHASRPMGELIWVDTQALSRAGVVRPEVLELFRPGLIEDLVGIDPAFDRWRAVQIERLSGLARSRAEEWLTFCQQAGDDAAGAGTEAVINAAELLIGIDRAHEGAWRALIRAHAAKGDRAAAVSAYERCADALAAVAQLAPSEETAALLSTIRNRDSAPTLPAVPGNIGFTAGDAKSSDASAVPLTPVGHHPVRIGVLPLRILNPSQSDELSLGLAEEITYALSRLSWLSCVAPSTMMAPPQQNAARQVGGGAAWRSLDLDLLLEGTVQRGGGQVRVMTGSWICMPAKK
jgi:DNA-binding SARP family transcriptional activator/TolB-like protein